MRGVSPRVSNSILSDSTPGDLIPVGTRGTAASEWVGVHGVWIRFQTFLNVGRVSSEWWVGAGYDMILSIFTRKYLFITVKMILQVSCELRLRLHFTSSLKNSYHLNFNM
jgi:hypothetical protein